MLIEPMIQQLHQLRLHGMAGGLEHLLRSAQLQALSFEERLSVMIQHELTERDSKRLAQPCAGQSCRRTQRSKTSTRARHAASIQS